MWQHPGRREHERIGGAVEEMLCREGVRRSRCQAREAVEAVEARREGCHEGEKTTWQESLRKP